MISRQITDLQEQLSRMASAGEEDAPASSVAAVDPEACGGCGACESACPEGAIRVEDKVATVAADECTGCGQCVEACPDNAIAMVARDGGPSVDPST
ncbi:MAG: 4Fe-4S dicluster domain-containing protein [Candidatus Latescibacterota bacterium]